MTYDEMALTMSVDPGPEYSAWVQMDGGRLVAFGYERTADTRERVREFTRLQRVQWGEGPALSWASRPVAIEMIACYGMGVGAEVFQTCLEIGRMIEIAPHALLVERLKVKIHLCKKPNANDSNVRTALLDRFGPGKEKAIGKKASPGPLYGVSGDVWAALALGCYLADIDAAL